MGSSTFTGSWNRTQTPRSPLVAKVTPRSFSDRWAGPAVRMNEYPPVAVTSAMLVRGVSSLDRLLQPTIDSVEVTVLIDVARRRSVEPVSGDLLAHPWLVGLGRHRRGDGLRRSVDCAHCFSSDEGAGRVIRWEIC